MPPATMSSNIKSGFALAPILYLIALAGIAGAVLFTGYTQILRSNVEITADNNVRNQIRLASEVLASRTLINGNPPNLLPQAVVAFSSLDAARLPKDASGVTVTESGLRGSAHDVGGLPTAGGVHALDPWGRYYIYCRWESPQSPGTGASMSILSAGADGKISTNCDNTLAATGTDDRMEFFSVANVLSRAATWQAQGDNTFRFGVSGDPTAARVVVGLDTANADTTKSLDIGGDGRFRGSLQVDGNATINGTTTVGTVSGGAGTFNSLLVSNNASVGGDFGVTGNTTLTGALGVTGATSLGSLSAGSSSLGATTASTINVGGLAQINYAILGGATPVANVTLNVKGATLLQSLQAGSGSFSDISAGSGSIGGSLSAGVLNTDSIVPSSGTVAVTGALTATSVTAGTGTFTTLTVTNPINGSVTGSAGSANSVTASGVSGCCVALSSGGTGYGASSITDLTNHLAVTVGTYTQAHSADLDALAALTSIGFVRRTGSGGYNAGPILQAEVPVFNGALAGTAGSYGGVPAPAAGQQSYILVGGGTWVDPNTIFSPTTIGQDDSGITVTDPGTGGAIVFKVDNYEQGRITNGQGATDRTFRLAGGKASNNTPVTFSTYSSTGSDSVPLQFGTQNGGAIIFRVSGANQLTITSTGQVQSLSGFYGSLTGNASTATKLYTARNISTSGDITATATAFDGSADITIPTTVAKIQGVAVSATAPVNGQVLTYNGTAWIPGSISGGTIDGGTIGQTSGTSLVLPDGTVTTPALRFLNSTGMGLYRPASDTLGITTAGVERLRINASGQVGIGTTSPGSALEVKSNTDARIFSTGSASTGFVTSSPSDTNYPIYTGTRYRASSAAVQSGDVLSMFSGRGSDGASLSGNTGMQAVVDGTVGTGSLPTRLVFSTAPSGSLTELERMRIDNAGNVGIGTTSTANTRLNVAYSTTDASAASSAINATGVQTITANNTNYFMGVNSGVSPKISSGVTGSGVYAAYYGTATPNGANAGTVTSLATFYGNYGIATGGAGTVGSAYGLYLNPYAQAGTINNSYGIYIASPQTGGTLTNEYGVYQNSGTAKNVFMGKVGMGVVPSSNQLEVANSMQVSGTSGQISINRTAAAGQSLIRISDSSSTATWTVGMSVVSNSAFRIASLNSGVAMVMNGTKVGIDLANNNNLSPATMLDVNGAIRMGTEGGATGASCSGMGGAIRYNSTTTLFESCNGTNWGSLASNAGALSASSIPNPLYLTPDGSNNFAIGMDGTGTAAQRQAFRVNATTTTGVIQSIALAAGGSDQMTIGSNSNVTMSSAPNAQLILPAGQTAGGGGAITVGSTNNAGLITFSRASDGNAVASLGYPSKTDSSELRLSSGGGGGYLTFFTAGSNERMRIDSTGNFRFGASSSPYFMTINGQAGRTIGMERDLTAATPGQGLTINAGGAYSGGTDLAGGNLLLSSGTSTGAGTSSIAFYTAPTGVSGTADNVPTQKMIIDGDGNVAIGTSASSLNRLRVSISVTDPTAIVRAGSYFVQPAVTTGTNANNVYGFSSQLLPDVRSGATVSGSYIGINTVAQGDSSVTGGGALTTLTGINAQYGMSTGAAGTIVNAYGVRIVPQHAAGTITNSYGLYIATPTTGGTVTNEYGVYQASTTAANAFFGKLGVGTASPGAKLHVQGNAVIGDTSTTGYVTGGRVVQVYTGNTANANAGIDITRGANATYGTASSVLSLRLMSDGSGVYRGAIGFAAADTPNEVISIVGSGAAPNVGIANSAPAAKLDVNGAIRMANDTTSCTATNAGAIRYTTALGFEACHGGAWVALDNAATAGGGTSIYVAKAGDTMTGALSVPPGNAGAPSINFSDATTTGFFHPTGSYIGVTVGGSTVANFNNAGLASSWFFNLNNGSNSSLNLNNNGAIIARNIADANPALVINQSNAGSTGDIVDFNNSGGTVARITQAGLMQINYTGSLTSQLTVGGAITVTGSGTTTPGLSVMSNSSSNNGVVNFYRYNASGTAVSNGLTLGGVNFSGYDGTSWVSGGGMGAAVDGTVGTNNVPSRLTFSTTPASSTTPVERMRIDSAGNVGIGAAPLNSNTRLYSRITTSDPTTNTVAALTGTVINNYTTGTNSIGGFAVAASTYSTAASGATFNGVGWGADFLHQANGAGAVNGVGGVRAQYGINSTGTGTVTNAYGFYALPYHQAGTITNSYGLFLANPSTGGTVTNEYGVYQQSATASNVFLGNTGIGTTAQAQRKLNVLSTLTDATAASYSVFSQLSPSYTAANSYSVYGTSTQLLPSVASGVSVTGTMAALQAYAVPHTSNAGSISNLTGVFSQYGFAGGSSGTLSNAYGFYAQANGASGTVTNSYGLYISTPSTGGSIINEYGVYQNSPNASNRFAGTMSVGQTSAPAANTKLDVAGAVKIGAVTGGTGSTTCTSTLAGTIQYDSTNNFQVCMSMDSGTTYAWQTINVSGTVGNPFYMTPDASNLLYLGANGSDTTAVNRQYMQVTADKTTGDVTKIAMYTSGVNKFRLDSAGKITVGDVSGASSGVLGDITISRTGNAATLVLEDDDSATAFTFRPLANLTSADAALGNINFQNRYSVAAQISGATDAASSGSSDQPGRLVFSTAADGTTTLVERMRIDNAGNFRFGASSSAYFMTLNGTAARTIGLERNTTAATAGQNLTINAGGAIAGGTDLAGGNLLLSSGTSTGAGSSSIAFYTAAAGATGTVDSVPSQKMIITGAGNVGIGTTSPGGKLGVQDAAVDPTATVTTTSSYLPFSISSNNNNWGESILGWVSPSAGSGFTTNSFMVGVHGKATTGSGNTGTISRLVGVMSEFGTITGTGNVTNAYGFYASPINLGGTVTNSYGLYLSSPSTGGTLTNEYGVYQNSATANNYFAGNVAIGTNGFASTPFYKFNSLQNATDPTSTPLAVRANVAPTLTTNNAQGSVGVYGSSLPAVASGVTSSGANYGIQAEASIRSGQGGGGTLATMAAYMGQYGIQTGAPAATTITNAYGLVLNPYHQAGTIANSYGIYLNSPTTGGTVTNEYGIYQLSSTATNTFFGTMGLGISGTNGAQLAVKTGTGQDTTISILRNANSDRAMIKFIPTGSASASNVTWYSGMFGSGNNYSVSYYDGTATVNSLTLANTGKVGVGVVAPAAQLDVNGAVKIANDTASCSATNAGAIRYTTALGYEACHGGAWVALDNAGSGGSGTSAYVLKAGDIMTGQLQLPAGSTTTPALTFTGLTTADGIYATTSNISLKVASSGWSFDGPSGYLYTKGIANNASNNNAFVGTTTAGTQISRNVADANAALLVTQSNASSTGDIMQFANNTGIRARIQQDGTYYGPLIKSFTGSIESLIYSDTVAPYFRLTRSRASTAVVSGDSLGALQLGGYDGTNYRYGLSSIASAADGTVTTSSFPTNLTFSTTPTGTITPVTRMTIDNVGNVAINASTVTNAKLYINTTMTDPATSRYGVYNVDASNYTANTVNSYYGVYGRAGASAASGVVVSGQQYAVVGSSITNSASHVGTISSSAGVSSIYGITNAGTGGTVTNAYGFIAQPYHQSGTITNSYGLYLASPVTGGTVTNEFGVYQAASSASNYFAGNIGVGVGAVSNYKLYTSYSPADPTTSAIGARIVASPSLTASNAQSATAVWASALPNPGSGLTTSGSYTGIDGEATVRSGSGGGTVADMRGVFAEAGIRTGATTGTTATNSYGVFVQPYHQAGTITNSYALYLNTPSTGGTVTNEYGVYQVSTTASNRFGGNMSIGQTTAPATKLDVAGGVKVAAEAGSCVVGLAGTIQYDSTNNFRVCMSMDSGATYAWQTVNVTNTVGNPLYFTADGSNNFAIGMLGSGTAAQRQAIRVNATASTGVIQSIALAANGADVMTVTSTGITVNNTITTPTNASLNITPGVPTTTGATGNAITMTGGTPNSVYGVGGAVTIAGGNGINGYKGGAVSLIAGVGSNTGTGTVGATATVRGGDGAGSSSGGALVLGGGDVLTGGAGNGGAITIKGGKSIGGGYVGGSVSITGGDSGTTTNGSTVSITGGNGASANYNGGNVILTGGAKGTGGAGGANGIIQVASNMGIGTATATYPLSFTGQSAQTIWMERNTTASTAGQTLTMQSGGAYSGGTDLAGGNLLLSSGTSTGAGQSSIAFYTSGGGASGTADVAPAQRMIIDGVGNVGIGASTANGYRLAVSIQPTDPTTQIAAGRFSAAQNLTASNSNASYGISASANPVVGSGITTTGSYIGSAGESTFRSGTGGGTAADMRSVYAEYGIRTGATTGSAATNIYGFYALPYHQAGTVTNSYGLYLASPLTGGTVTNEFGVYQASTTAKNVFMGNTGIGATPGSYMLDVGGNYGSQLVVGKANQGGLISFRRGSDAVANASIGYSTATDATTFQIQNGSGSGIVALGTNVSGTQTNILNVVGGTTGRVGVGTVTPATLLDVAGGMKIANETTACSGTLAGTIRYTTALGFEACHGGAWISLDNASTAGGGTSVYVAKAGDTMTGALAIARNVADANAALLVTQSNASSTGDIVDFNNSTGTMVSISQAGLLTGQKIRSNTGQIESNLASNTLAPAMTMYRFRSGVTSVQSGDVLGSLQFGGYDGTNQRNASSISSAADGAITTSSFPTNLTFSTTPSGSITPQTRMTIDNAGNVGIGTTPSSATKVYVTNTLTDPSVGRYGVYSYDNSSYTAANANTSYAVDGRVNPGVASGIILSGFQSGVVGAGNLNNGSHVGAISSMAGVRSEYGIVAAGTGGVITNAYGFYAQPYHQSGTITNSYGLYLSSPTTGGTVTNEYGVYQQSTTANNYFAGNIGIGMQPSSTNKLAVSYSPADPAGNSASYILFSPTYTGSSASGASALNISMIATMPSSFSQTNQLVGALVDAQRVTGGGTYSSVVGGRFNYGLLSTATSGTTINNAYGVYVQPYHQAGTVANSYGLYLSSPTGSGATVTNEYGVYQASANASNRFAGNMSVGQTTAPATKLDVAGGVKVAAEAGSCVVGLAGTIQYDSTNNFRVCMSMDSGTTYAWQTVNVTNTVGNPLYFTADGSNNFAIGMLGTSTNTTTSGGNGFVDRQAIRVNATATTGAIQSIALATAGTDRLTVNASGQVSINSTTNPGSNLYVSGTARFGTSGGENATWATGTQYYYNNSTYSGLDIQNRYTAANNGTSLTIWDDSGNSGSKLSLTMPSSINTTTSYGITGKNIVSLIAANGSINSNAGRAFAIGTANNNDVFFVTAGSERMRIDNAGNFRFGASASTYFMTVNGQAARTLGMERATTAATAGQSLTINSGGAYSGGTDLAGGNLLLSSGTATGTGTSSIAFYTASAGSTGAADNAPSQKMIITGAGLVGIGTATPSTDLAFDGSAARTIGMETAAAASAGSSLTIKAGSSGAGTNLVGGNLTLSSGATTGSAGSQIQFLTATSGSSGTTTNTPTAKMTIASSGSVGINTAYPGRQFEILSYNAFAARLTRSTNVATSYVGQEYNMLNSSAAQVVYGFIGGGVQANTATAENGFLTFQTIQGGALTEAMRITGTGSVGVGVAAPAANVKLDVAGAIKHGTVTGGTGSVTCTSTLAGTMTYDSTNNFQVCISMDGGTTYAWQTINVSGSSMGNPMYFTPDGSNNFAIGMAGSGTAAQRQAIRANATASTGVIQSIALSTAGSDRVTIDNSGSTLIESNTASNSPLTVQNDNSSGYSRIVFNNQSATAKGFVGFYNTAASTFPNSMVLGSSSTQSLILATNSLERMRIDGATGNVGIGTATPSTALSFDGSAARTIGMERTTGSGGSNLTLMAGGGVVGGSDKNGGSLILSGGIATGAAGSSVLISTSSGGTTGTSDVTPTNKVIFGANGYMLLGRNLSVSTPVTYGISFDGDSSNSTIGTQRATTASTVGKAMTITAGGAVSGGTDLAGGNLLLSSGTATGTGSSSIAFYTASAASTGTTDNAPTQKMIITGAGLVGLGTASPSYSIAFDATAARSIGVERQTAASSVGSDLSIYAGSATLAGTDLNGGNLNLSSGIGTGTGGSGMTFSTSRAGTTGTSSHALTTAMAINTSGAVVIGNGVTTSTGSANTALTVTGNAQLSATNPIFTINKGPSGAGTFIFSNAGGYRWVFSENSTNESGSNSGSDFQLKRYADDGSTVLGTPLFMRRSDGMIGINNVAPATMLDVAGGVKVAAEAGTCAVGLAGTIQYDSTNNFRVCMSMDGGTTYAWQTINVSGNSVANPFYLTPDASNLITFGANGSDATAANRQFQLVTADKVTGDVSGISWLSGGASRMVMGNTSLAFGATGATNPAFSIDASAASSATGLSIASAAAGSGVTLQTTSSGTNEGLTIAAKGTGSVILTTNAASNRITLASGSTTYSNGTHAFTTTVSGAPTTRFLYTGNADAGLTASTESHSVHFNMGQVRQHATGAITTQRDFRITPSTHSFAGASAITNAVGAYIDGPPIAGTNASISNSHALYVDSRAVGSGVTNSYGLTVYPSTGATNNYAAFFNGAVGIGTAAPVATLHVIAPAVASGQENIFRGGTSDTGDYFAIANSTAVDSRISPAIYGRSNHSAYTGLNLVAGGSDSGSQPLMAFSSGVGAGDLVSGPQSAATNRPLFAFSNAGTRVMTMFASGNVGIGNYDAINGPWPSSFTLGFQGNIARTIGMERNMTPATAGQNLTLQAGGAYSGGTDLAGGSLLLSSGTATGAGTSSIAFYTSGGGASGTTDTAPVQRMIINGAGNVGIGTNAPSASLHVATNNASGLQVGGATAGAFTFNTFGNFGGVIATNGLNTSNIWSQLNSSYATWLYNMGGSNDFFEIQRAAAGSSNTQIANSPVLFYIGSSGLTGIGVTSPATRLDVAGGVKVAAEAGTCAVGLAGTIQYDSTNNFRVCMSMDGGTTYAWQTINVSGTSMSNPLYFTADASNNFAIGMAGTSTNTSGGNGFVDRQAIRVNATATTGAVQSIALATAGADALTIANTGNVVIGTGIASTGYKLNLQTNMRIVGNSASSSIDMQRSNGGGIVVSGDTLGTQSFSGHDGTQIRNAASILAAADGTVSSGSMPGRLVFSTTPSGSVTPVERMRIDNTGNLGIGTSSASYTRITAAIGTTDVATGGINMTVTPASTSGNAQSYAGQFTIVPSVTAGNTNNSRQMGLSVLSTTSSANTGTLGNVYGVYSTYGGATGYGGTTTSAYGFYAQPYHQAGTLTGTYGLYIASPIGSGATVTNEYGVYQASSTAKNVFMGNTGIGASAIAGSKLYTYSAPTDIAANTNSTTNTLNPTYTANNSFTAVSNVAFMQPSVASGVTANGTQGAMQAYAIPAPTNAGNVSVLVGNYVQYGMGTTSGGTVTSAYGVLVSPYHQAGTITNSYGVYIGAPATGGTVTNEYGVYQNSTTARNVFAGTRTTFSGTVASTSTTTGTVIIGGGVGVTGDIFASATMNASAFVNTSDRRLKDNIKSFDSGLQTIKKLRGVTFNWKKDGTPAVGLIAQEVEEVLPQLVTTDGNGMKAVMYSNLVAPIIEAIKELSAKVDDIAAQLANLFSWQKKADERLQTIEQKLDSIGAENARLKDENAKLQALVERVTKVEAKVEKLDKKKPAARKHATPAASAAQ